MAAFAGLCTASATYGMGVHAADLTFHQSTNGMLLLLAGQSVIEIAMGVSKPSLPLPPRPGFLERRTQLR